MTFGPDVAAEPTTEMLNVDGMVLFEGGCDFGDVRMKAARDVEAAMGGIHAGTLPEADPVSVPEALGYDDDITTSGTPFTKGGKGA